jgi:glucarate dehydratase
VKVTEVRLTPIAFADPPLLNSKGVHQPYALRAVVELVTDEGLVGLGETYGDDAELERLRAVAPRLVGLDPFDLNGLTAAVRTVHPGLAARAAAIVVAGFEVACVDLQGKALGLPACTVLGGRVRDTVPYAGYLFYKWAGEDPWGEALDPAGIVAQARRMVDTWGFTSLKLKGGVFRPEEEIEAVLALREAFPDHPLRLDPNTAWTVETSVRVGERLAGVLEYLEDPCAGIPGMAEVARRQPLPLATNMCVVSFPDVAPAVREGAIQVVLADHHYWGGLRASGLLAGIAGTVGWGVSMHSNSHLGISLAAMTHLAAATPNLTYASDTHTPWQDPADDIIEPALPFVDGAVAVPTAPGLGVTLDRDNVARLHEQYLTCGIRTRDDIAAMRAHDPAWTGRRPRF